MKAAAPLAALLVLLAGCLSDAGFGDRRGDSVGHPEALLRSRPFPDLVVDIDYMAGATPTPESLDAAFAAMRGVVAKGRITIEDPTLVPGGPRVWDQEGIRAAAEAARDAGAPRIGADGVARLQVLYARGTYGNATDDSTASGLYEPGAAAVVLFPDTWRDAGAVAIALLASGIPPAWLEAEVLTHEIGHAMGLVNYQIPALTGRIAPDDPCECHSSRAASVMFPGVHDAQTHLQGMLARQEAAPMGYDDEDKADLAAFRDGATGPPLK